MFHVATSQVDPDRWGSAVAETIRAERAAAKLSQAEVSRRSGIPRPTYLRYESGERNPTFAQLAAIATAIGMPLSTFTKRVTERAEGR